MNVDSCAAVYYVLGHDKNKMAEAMTATASGGGPTPPQEAEQQHFTHVYADYLPNDIKYSADFEDSLIDAVLNSTSTSPGPEANIGIRVIPEDSDERPISGISIRYSDISPSSLPNLTEDDLPLPLSDPRRTFASPLPGVKLTHPCGYLEGGPPLNPEMDTLPDDFLSHRPEISTADQLREAVAKEVEEQVEVLEERLRARQKARARNEQIQRELKVLTDQHDMERRIHERITEEQRRKKEARERKRRGEGSVT